jgi:hypothetical protein
MATFTKQLLSGSSNGRQVSIVAVATPGTLIHTAVSGVTDFDEIWLWATNTDATNDVILTLEWGGTSTPADKVIVEIPPSEGLVLIIPGLILQNSLVVRAFADTASVINISGFVNRITS